MKKLLIFVLIFGLALTSQGQKREKITMPTIAAMKNYSGGAEFIFVTDSATGGDFYLYSGSTVADELVIYAGAGSRKWRRLLSIGVMLDTLVVKSPLNVLFGNRNDTLELSNITGFISAGTNVTLDGTGSLDDPYVINSSGGGGGVSSVGLAMPGGFSVSGSPVTTSGTLTVSTTLNGIITGNGSAFNAVTTSLGLSTILSDETGTAGSLVFSNSPTIVTPTIASFTNAQHNHTNAAGGGQLAEGALNLTDITTNNATTLRHGFLPKLSGNAGEYLDGTGNWSVPAGGGGGGNISSINAQTGPNITLAVGTAGSDFSVSAATNTITFNLPNAGSSVRGVVSTDAQTFAGAKTFTSSPILPNGTVSAPSFGFSSQTNTGIYRAAVNTVGIATNGIAGMRVDPTTVTLGTYGNETQNIVVQDASGGSNRPGMGLAIYAGAGVGNQPGGDITMFTSPSGESGSSVNPGVERLRITSGGNVGIGTNAPSARLHIRRDIPGTNGPAVVIQEASNDGFPMISFQGTGRTYNIGAGNHAAFFGLENDFFIFDDNAGAARLVITDAGVVRIGNLAGTGTRAVVTDGSGNLSAVATTGSGNFVRATSPTITTPTIASFTNAQHNHTNAAGGGQIDHGLSLTGLNDDDHLQYALLAGRSGGQILIGGSGTTDDLILRVTSGAGTTGADMIFQGGSNGATEFARFLNNGNFGVGITPTAKLHIAAGSTSLAPLKLTSGAVLTTPQAGSMEYDGSNIYFTPSTIRKRLALVNNVAPANGQIPIGNGTDFTIANLISSDGSISITSGSGTLDLEVNGAVTGSGVTGRLTYWNGTSTVTSNANLFYNESGSGQLVVVGEVATGRIVVGDNRNFNGASAPQMYLLPSTYTDNTTAGGGTISYAINIIGTPTIAANNAINVTSPVTLSISSPIAGANVTFTTPPYALSLSGAMEIGGGIRRSFSGISTGTTAIDYTRDIISCNATAGNVTATLPNAANYSGFTFTIKRTDASSNTVTINTTSAQTIDGSATYSLTAQWKYVTVVSNGSNWLIIANN